MLYMDMIALCILHWVLKRTKEIRWEVMKQKI